VSSSHDTWPQSLIRLIVLFTGNMSTRTSTHAHNCIIYIFPAISLHTHTCRNARINAIGRRRSSGELGELGSARVNPVLVLSAELWTTLGTLRSHAEDASRTASGNGVWECADISLGPGYENEDCYSVCRKLTCRRSIRYSISSSTH
jgi:hypothetical protein